MIEEAESRFVLAGGDLEEAQKQLTALHRKSRSSLGNVTTELIRRRSSSATAATEQRNNLPGMLQPHEEEDGKVGEKEDGNIVGEEEKAEETVNEKVDEKEDEKWDEKGDEKADEKEDEKGDEKGDEKADEKVVVVIEEEKYVKEEENVEKEET